MNPKSLLLFILLFSSAVHAAQIRTIDEMKTLDISISAQDLTRITTKEDRILNVFGNTGDYVLETEESQGQIFIRPTQQESKKPFSLTLTTEKGRTQDLRLLPKDQPAEALILNPADEKQRENLKRTQVPISKEEVESLLQACKAGRIPLGYKRVPIHLHPYQEPYPLIQGLKGDNLRCLTYEVKHSFSDGNNKQLLKLSEPQFVRALNIKKQDIIAVLMPKHTLSPGEKTYVYVITRPD